jgi:hypothetical protein
MIPKKIVTNNNLKRKKTDTPAPNSKHPDPDDSTQEPQHPSNHPPCPTPQQQQQALAIANLESRPTCNEDQGTCQHSIFGQPPASNISWSQEQRVRR